MATLSQAPLFSCFPGSSVYHPNSSTGVFYKRSSRSRSLRPQFCRPSAVLQTMEHTVTVHSTSLVTPIKASEGKSVFLSNIDKLYNVKATTILFFKMNPDFPFEEIVVKLKISLRKALVQYDFLAGRLRCNNEDGRLELDCNGAGAGFRVASCNMSFEELRATGFPNTANKQFALRNWNVSSADDQPVLIIQVTSLRCGGFVLGFLTNHVTVDGITSKIFMENLASLLADNDLVLPPYNNRRLLSARSPPRATFPHPELFNSQGENNPKATFQKLTSKYFQFSHNDIMHLKQKARMGCNVSEATAFNVVAAHIWKCVAKAKNQENDLEQLSTVLYAVNIRSRVRPRLPSSYAGNAIVSAYATTSCGEIQRRPLSHLVEMISQGDRRVNDEYVKSFIDWLELHKGFPYGDTIISSWWHMRFNEIDFPWGKPQWSCPVVPSHGNSTIILMPEVEGQQSKGLQILVSLQHKQMDIFEGLFHDM